MRSIEELLKIVESGNWTFSDDELQSVIDFYEKLDKDLSLLLRAQGQAWIMPLRYMWFTLNSLIRCRDARSIRLTGE